MKIQVFVRSPEWLHTAGTRIRYRRLQRELSLLGCTLAIDPISGIREGLKLNADAYLFSKCNDAGTMMLADMLREAGALVGFDLFDDYVSDRGSTTAAQRIFQRRLREKADFFLCSTARMAKVAQEFDPTTANHVLHDPLETYDADRLPGLLEAKAEAVRASGRMDLVWFGVGNNPIYPVGLSDLVGFWETLKPLKAAGLNLHIRVLTNADALDAEGLSRLRNLPLELEIEEWSSAAEKAALERAFLAFLPVNYQNFSIAKSLNRAITALTHGNQVLTAGHELYDPLDTYIYKDACLLLSDLKAGSLRVRRETVKSLGERLFAIAGPAEEASRFLTFLCNIPSGSVAVPVEKRRLRAIVHGADSTPAIGNLCRALGWLSLGSPITRQPLPFHAQVGFFDEGKCLELRLSRDALPRLVDGWSRLAVVLSRPSNGEFTHSLPIRETIEGEYLASVKPEWINTRAGRMVNAKRLMAAIEATYLQVFGDLLLSRSEMEMPLQAIDEFLGW